MSSNCLRARQSLYYFLLSFAAYSSPITHARGRFLLSTSPPLALHQCEAYGVMSFFNQGILLEMRTLVAGLLSKFVGPTIQAYGGGDQRPPQIRSMAHQQAYNSGISMRSQRRRAEHEGSRQLTAQENQLLYETLGSDRVSLCAAVVQLLRASGGAWLHEHVGVVSLVKDYTRKVYALMLFDIYSSTLLWQQIL